MKLNKTALMLSVAAIAHAPAYAAEGNPGYFGVSAGQATVDDFCDGTEASCDDSALALRIYGGTELNSFANLEFGYRYIDDVEASGVIDGVGVAAAVNGHFVDTTLQLGMPESGPFKVFTKAGLMLWRLNYEVAASNGFQTLSVSDDDTGVAFRTGLGMSYEISEEIRLRADWDLLLNVGDEDELGETDINVFSVGPEFRF
ncbi:outer membrane beta-barrel protein [Marinobacter sediminum]|uniref:outer membrane beta-barrel protein n=1 Tax=Marinobacter sediminum TaxID=256323 RepID=UPI00202E0B69|nr:outer membrane beta-barrel protein [Marinobacter sediminum]MCM0612183.1 outer membrane beta-barrel protein [Marinobacter sediminum]